MGVTATNACQFQQVQFTKELFSKMRSLLHTVVIVYLVICGMNWLYGKKASSSIDVTINPSSHNALVWHPSDVGRYFLLLRYDVDLLPEVVKRNLSNSSNTPRGVWEATLTVMTNGMPLLSKTTITATPAIESGRWVYFMIGECEFTKPVRVEISLDPREPPPFGGLVPSFTLRPMGTYYKTLQAQSLFWLIAYCSCIPAIIALLVDYFLHNQRRLKLKG